MSIYEPLPDDTLFRILKLRPGQWDDDIVRNLDFMTYEASKDNYEAIPYC